MSIGRGWYEDSINESEPEEFKRFKARKELAVNLLKEKLDYVFKMIAANPNKNNLAPRGRNYG